MYILLSAIAGGIVVLAIPTIIGIFAAPILK